MNIMKRIILFVVSILFVLCLTSCESLQRVNYIADGHEPSMFTIVETTRTWYVVYHNESFVMYSVTRGQYGGRFTLLVNPDGSPMIYQK